MKFLSLIFFLVSCCFFHFQRLRMKNENIKLKVQSSLFCWTSHVFASFTFSSSISKTMILNYFLLQLWLLISHVKWLPMNLQTYGRGYWNHYDLIPYFTHTILPTTPHLFIHLVGLKLASGAINIMHDLPKCIWPLTFE